MPSVHYAQKAVSIYLIMLTTPSILQISAPDVYLAQQVAVQSLDVTTLLPLSENFLLAYLMILLWLFSC